MHLSISRGTDTSKSPFSHFKSNSFNTEGRQWHSKKHKQPRNSIVSVLTHVNSLYSTIYAKRTIEKEEKDRANQFPFVLPIGYMLYLETIGRMCINQKVKSNKLISLYSVPTLQERQNSYACTSYEIRTV